MSGKYYLGNGPLKDSVSFQTGFLPFNTSGQWLRIVTIFGAVAHSGRQFQYCRPQWWTRDGAVIHNGDRFRNVTYNGAPKSALWSTNWARFFAVAHSRSKVICCCPQQQQGYLLLSTAVARLSVVAHSRRKISYCGGGEVSVVTHSRGQVLCPFAPQQNPSSALLPHSRRQVLFTAAHSRFQALLCCPQQEQDSVHSCP